MASVSVVSPHTLDSKPLLVLKKRKSSWEKMMFRRSPGSGGECAPVAAEGEPGTHPLSPRPAGGMPGEGCGASAAPAAPRSPDRHREEGSADCDRRPAGWTRGGQTGHITGDCNSNTECDSNHNTGGRRGALMRLAVNDVPSASVANGLKGAQRRRDAAHGRRDCRNGDSGHQSVSSSGSTAEDSGGLSLERLTQGRTGVVRLARNERPRRQAWSIFPQGVDPRVRTERGEGHRFEAKLVKQAWCDSCPRQITAQALKCQNCSYTCHLECESQVQVDCNQRDRETPSPRSHCSTARQHKKNEAKEEEERGTKDLSEEEVRTKIDAYNTQVSTSGMNLASDGSYTGFIKVHLRLSRPVTVPAVEAEGPEGASRQPGVRNRAPPEGREGTDGGQSEKRTSFYLPCDCVKQIHIGSVTTTREVIEGLLKKFMVLDNPCKFALYRQTHRDGQDLFQKLPLGERPLLLRLIAGPDPEQLSFVLKENETGEVEWHAFSVPELQNFLVILEKEEAERVRTVQHKYAMYRQKLQLALQQHDP